MVAERERLLQAASVPCSPPVIKPLSLHEACLRVGHIIDLWHTNPPQLLQLLEQGCRKEVHPLRGLFTPTLHAAATPDPTSVRTETPAEFCPGQRVKVRLDAALREQMDAEWPASNDRFADTSKEWEPASIAAQNTDGTYSVKWDAGYQTNAVHAKDSILKTEDLAKARHIEDTLQVPVKVTPKTGLLLLCIAAIVVCVPQLLAFAFGKDPCAERSINSYMELLCHANGASFARSGGGFLIGAGCLLCNCAGAFLVYPCTYKLVRVCCPAYAQMARSFVEAVGLDPIRLFGLPTVYGKVEAILLVFFNSMNISGIIMAALTLDPGLIPLTFLLSTRFLTVMNAAFGEKSGYNHIRKQRILTLLEIRAEITKVDVSKEHLRYELDRLLDLPANAGILQISLGLLALIAGSCPIEHPDSKRIRTMLVHGAYAKYSHRKKELCQLSSTHDVVVDLFRKTCDVPGLVLVGERWCKEGGLLPWHLAVKSSDVKAFELELHKLGLPPGAGCFTWREVGGLPALAEARDPSALLNHSKRLAAEHDRLGTMLRSICNDAALDDDPEFVRPLIRAGADMNKASVKILYTPTHYAAQNNKVKTVKALFEAKADLSRPNHEGDTPLHKAFEKGQREAAQFLVTAGADLTTRNNSGEMPLEKKGPSALEIRAEMWKFVDVWQKEQGAGSSS